MLFAVAASSQMLIYLPFLTTWRKHEHAGGKTLTNKGTRCLRSASPAVDTRQAGGGRPTHSPARTASSPLQEAGAATLTGGGGGHGTDTRALCVAHTLARVDMHAHLRPHAHAHTCMTRVEFGIRLWTDSPVHRLWAHLGASLTLSIFTCTGKTAHLLLVTCTTETGVLGDREEQPAFQGAGTGLPCLPAPFSSP